MQLPPDLVIFDCDGVLVDSEPLTTRVIRDDLADHGLDLSTDRIIDLFVGGTMPGVMQKAREMGAQLPASWLEHIYARLYKALSQQVEPVPGIVAVLDALDAAGIPYAIGSNGPHAKMDVTLKRTGLWERMHGRIVSREDVAKPKPAPDVYLKAAEIVGVPTDRCIVVEDSASGAHAGKAAGMRTLGYVADTDAEKLTGICDALFDTMADLPGLLGIAVTHQEKKGG